MSEFQNALDLVTSTLVGLRDQGADLKVSNESLARLLAVAPAPVSKPASVAQIEKPIAAAVPRIKEAEPVTPATPVLPKPTKAPEARPTAPAELVRSEFTGERIAPLEGTKAERLEAMRGPVLACTKCPHLVKSRTQVVFGVGNPDARLMFVGEAPGEDEDRQGEPFVGKAGQLLTKIIETMGFARKDVFIANVLKCRPDMPPGMPGNRKPKTEEMQTCVPYLKEQIDIIQPEAIVALGATAIEGLTGMTDSMSRLRGRWHSFQGIPLMATYHPAYLLRNQALSEKRKVWEDMLMVLERMGAEISEKQRNYFLSK